MNHSVRFLMQKRAGGLLLLSLILGFGLAACSSTRPSTPSSTTRSVQNRSERDEKMESFIDDLISRMTLEEKLGQLTQFSWEFATGPTAEPPGSSQARYRQLVREGKVGSFFNVFGTDWTRELQRLAVEESRLKIPLIFGFDVIHGYRTIFPVPLGEAASFDPEAAERSARIAAIEASAVGLHWTFAPMVDIARDARWGRIVEGSGEDPYLGSVLAVARVRGFQGSDLSAPNTIAATTKHYAAYGAAEAGRDYNISELSERSLRQFFLPPYHATVGAGVATFMSSFNEIGGIPASGAHFLQTDILRGEWGFDGFVVSDWTSVAELMAHGVAATRVDAGVLALTAGVDMDMQSGIYPELTGAVGSGRVPMNVVNEAVRRILRIKYRLGLFDDPYRYSNPERERTELLTAEHLRAAREIARESMVLLKNDGNVLPLRKNIGTLAVIGPLADSRQDAMGSWIGRGEARDVTTVLQGIRDAVSSGTRVLYARGTPIDTLDRSGIDAAVAIARQADAVLLVLGEQGDLTGEAASRTSISLPGLQLELAQAVLAVGKPTAAVLMSRPLAIPELAERCPAILQAWHPGTQAGPAVADVIFGDFNPSGKLPATFPRAVGQEPLYYNHKSTGRPTDEQQKYTSRYIDLPSTPLYPFGHGLSYTTFEYRGLRIAQDQVQAGDTVNISVQVSNTGQRAGTEVVQLYVRDPVASVTMPVRELKGFQRVTLGPGEARTVTFRMPVNILALYDVNMRRVVEPGEIQVMVGTSSADNRQTGSFRIGGSVTEIPRSAIYFTEVRVQ